jgi:hypothetical protein
MSEAPGEFMKHTKVMCLFGGIVMLISFTPNAHAMKYKCRYSQYVEYIRHSAWGPSFDKIDSGYNVVNFKLKLERYKSDPIDENKILLQTYGFTKQKISITVNGELIQEIMPLGKKSFHFNINGTKDHINCERKTIF